jgi:hypothetical protein
MANKSQKRSSHEPRKPKAGPGKAKKKDKAPRYMDGDDRIGPGELLAHAETMRIARK